MKIIVVSLFICLSSLLLCGCGSGSQSAANKQLLSVPDHSFISLNLSGKPLHIEVVNTQQSTMQGLSDRDQIGSDGLLFIFPEKTFQRFWMKEMRFDLDLVWLDDLRIVDISENVPRPTSADQQLPVYSPKFPVNEVLEIPAGTAQKWQLKIGDTLGYSW